MNKLLLVIFCTILIACGELVEYEEIGTNIASPVAVIPVNDTHFVVLNSDYDFKFNQGSLLTLDKEGERVNSLTVPRLGQGAKLQQNNLFVIFATADGKAGLAEIFDVSSPTDIKSLKKFEFDCVPAGQAISTKYIVVSCNNGDILAGSISGGVASAELSKVRSFELPRRALYIDETNGLLYAFPSSEVSRDLQPDRRLADEKTITSSSNTAGANGVPDIYEDTDRKRRDLIGYQHYQMLVVDLDKLASENFPEPSVDIATYEDEFRWLYFNLTDEAGAPDDALDSDTKQKVYRSNFWDINADPFGGGNSFLISQRWGREADDETIQSNNIIRVTILADARVPGDLTTQFSFDRVYGSKAELPEEAYPGTFLAKSFNGKDMLLVNHFKDPATFRNDASFLISSKRVAEVQSDESLVGELPNFGFYEMGMMTDGTVLSGSFYDDGLVLFDMPASFNINDLNLDDLNIIK